MGGGEGMASTQGNEWECPWKEMRGGRYRWRRSRMCEHQLWVVEKIIVAAGTVIVGTHNAIPVGVDSGQVWKVLFVSSNEPFI